MQFPRFPDVVALHTPDGRSRYLTCEEESGHRFLLSVSEPTPTVEFWRMENGIAISAAGLKKIRAFRAAVRKRLEKELAKSIYRFAARPDCKS